MTDKETNPQEKTEDLNSYVFHREKELNDKDYLTFSQNKENENNERDSELSKNSSMKSTYSVTKPDSKFFHAFLNLTKSFLGMGPLTISSAMKYAGLGFGFISIFSCGLLALYGINIMVLSRRKILKERYLEGPDNYLPRESGEQHRELREDEIEQEEDDLGLNPLRISESIGGYTDAVIQSHHRIKTYSDLATELYGDTGYYLVTIVIFVQQLIVVISYFYYLNKFFPSYIVLIGITPICMF